MAAGRRFKGIVVGEIVEARFAYSGRVAGVYKRPGDTVKGGEILASLDRKEGQIQLDKELADYERVRAEFETFVLDHPNPGNDREKFEKVQKQATLNAAVKAVELVKLRLDDVDLRCPVAGIICGNGGLRKGLWATPSANPFQILEQASLVVECEMEWKEWENFKSGSEVGIKIEGRKETITGKMRSFVPDLQPSRKPKAVFEMAETAGVWPGMTASVGQF